jgi:hypothetical protein
MAKPEEIHGCIVEASIPNTGDTTDVDPPDIAPLCLGGAPLRGGAAASPCGGALRLPGLRWAGLAAAGEPVHARRTFSR